MADNDLAALLSGTNLNYADPAAMAVPRLKLAQTMMQQGTDSSPVQHPFQALARIAQAGTGQYVQNETSSDLAKAYSGQANSLAEALKPIPNSGPLVAALSNPQTAGVAIKQALPALLSLPKQAESTSQWEQEMALKRSAEERMLNEPKLVSPGQQLVSKTGEEIYTGDPNGPGLMDQDTLKDMAEQYRAGDTTVKQNLGRGIQGGQNLIALNKEISRQNRSAGISGTEQAQRNAEYQGSKAGQRALGTMEAKMGTAAFEAEGAIKLARDVIAKVPRTSFLPINKLIQGYQNQTLNPDQSELLTRIQGVRNTYAAVMARGANVTTDAARHRADEMLNTAGSSESMNRTLDTMLSEIDMAKHSPDKMREFYRSKYGANGIAAAPAAVPQETPKVGERKQFKQGWGVWDGTTYVPEK